MAYDVSLAEKGIMTALAMLDNQLMGRPLEYVKADNASDVGIAVDKARQLVESDGVQVMVGPIFSPATAAVTDFLAGSTGIPDISIMGQPSENLDTANGLAFIPCGLYGSHGYYFGKYCAEVLGYKTANCIHYEDTAAYQLQAGFEKGFAEGGGTVTTPVYVPMDTVDFSAYLTTMAPADCTLFWIFGAGAVPFVQQYKSYNLTAPLVVPMANNFSREQLAELGDLGVGMVACDIYVDTLENPDNQAFVAKYQELYPGEYPMPQGFGAALGMFMFAKAVEATGGDTTPAALIEVMSTMSLDSAAGKITMSPYGAAFIGTRDFFILETKKVDGVVQWVPIETISQVLLDEKK
jgi:branched-chain amino acid transport system substrate-binding protein